MNVFLLLVFRIVNKLFYLLIHLLKMETNNLLFHFQDIREYVLILNWNFLVYFLDFDLLYNLTQILLYCFIFNNINIVFIYYNSYFL